jgi:hypothetical protein
MYWCVCLQVLLGPDGRPLTSGTGLPLAVSPQGVPLMGPDGAPLCLAPDDEALLSWGGLPLLGPQVCAACKARTLSLGVAGLLLHVRV